MMIRHYFKVAIRNLSKQKILAFINVSGLSVGVACFILLFLYVVNELSFDRFNKNEKDIYLVYELTKASVGDAEGSVSLPMPLGPAMKKDMPDVVDYVRLKQPMAESVMRVDGDVRRVQVSYADPEFFSVFTFPFEYGNISTALHDIKDLVVTKTKAIELFGRDDVVGKTVQLKVENIFQSFVISAVVKDIPANSSIRFDVMGSFAFLETTNFGKRFNNWYTTSFRTYVQLQPGSGLPNDRKRLSAFHTTYNPAKESQPKKDRPSVTYGLQPLRSIHTDTMLNDPAGIATVSPKTIWIIFSIGAGVLFIACINFTTLAIGRSVSRRIEVGIRKVIGAERWQLVIQFLAEALLLSVFSTLLGLLLAELLLPYFNRLTGRELQFSFALYPEMGWLLISLVLIVGLLSGCYPAFVLSGFKPVEVLKNRLRAGGSNLFMKVLITLQFSVSTGLIISTIVILQQTKYMRTKNPGFNKENIIIIDVAQTDAEYIYPILKQSLTTHTGIIGVTKAEAGMGEGTDFGMHGFMYNGIHKSLYEYSIDPDYLRVLDMQLLKGRNFSSTISDDTLNNVIINESAMSDLGWTPDNVIGQRIKGYTNSQSPAVIGVVKNFNFQPLTERVRPQLFHQFAGHTPRKFFVRIKPGNPAPLLAYIKSTWTSLVPDAPFKYSFLDENLDNFYKVEQRWSSIIGWAAGISIFLACLGLFGLAAMSSVRRTKEIGIRKVFGASVLNIVNLISTDFVKLILMALLIASPVVWYFMNQWLQDYAYRINIQFWVFAAAGVAVLAIALLTVSFHALKAAVAKPVKSLRTE